MWEKIEISNFARAHCRSAARHWLAVCWLLSKFFHSFGMQNKAALLERALNIFFFCFLFFLQVGSRMCDRLRILYIRALMRQEMGFYDAQQTGKLCARVSGDVDLIETGCSKTALALQSFATFVGGFIVGFLSSWRLALVIVGCSPLLMCIGIFFSRLMSRFSQEGARGARLRAVLIAVARFSLSFQVKAPLASRSGWPPRR